MAIFAIIQQPGAATETLDAAIKGAYENANYPLGSGVWLVAGPGTAQEVSGKIGVAPGESGPAIVIEAASYFGRANPAIWSWVRANWEARPVG